MFFDLPSTARAALNPAVTVPVGKNCRGVYDPLTMRGAGSDDVTGAFAS